MEEAEITRSRPLRCEALLRFHAPGALPRFVYVAGQLGHASPKTTMDHYAHLLPGVDQSYADLLDESEADWQRFWQSLEETGIEIGKPVESV